MPTDIADSTPSPARIAAELRRRYPTAWSRFDEARAGRRAGLTQPTTWLTYGEVFSAYSRIFEDLGRSDVPIEVMADLYSFGTWRVTQGVYRFDAELLAALRDTPLDVSLPASLLTRLPEWAVYIETPGLTHIAKPIAGVVATLLDAPSGLSLMMTMLPENVVSIDDDLDRIQLHLTDMPLRERLALDVAATSDLQEQIAATLSAYENEGVSIPSDMKQEWSSKLAAALQADAIDTVLSGIVPFISLLLYLCSEEPDLPERVELPKGTTTKRGVRFFPPSQARIWPVGVRMGSALREARELYAEAGRGSRGNVRPHYRKAHWHKFWTGARNGERNLRIRWLMPVAVNIRADDQLPAVIHPVGSDS